MNKNQKRNTFGSNLVSQNRQDSLKDVGQLLILEHFWKHDHYFTAEGEKIVQFLENCLRKTTKHHCRGPGLCRSNAPFLKGFVGKDQSALSLLKPGGSRKTLWQSLPGAPTYSATAGTRHETQQQRKRTSFGDRQILRSLWLQQRIHLSQDPYEMVIIKSVMEDRYENLKPNSESYFGLTLYNAIYCKWTYF